MRSPKLQAVLLVTALAAACAPDAPTIPAADAEGALFARSAANCENVRGTLSGNVFQIWGLTFVGDISGPGTLTGPPALDPKGARGQGAILLTTQHAIQTADGLIVTMDDQGVLAPMNPPTYRLINRYTISGGTGAYADATGFMIVVATVNLATGEIEGRYHGRVCR